MTSPAGQLFHAQLKPFGVSGRPEGDFGSLPKNIFCYDAGTMEQLPLTPYLQPMVIKHMDIPMKDFCLLRDRDTVIFQVQLLIDPYDEGGRGEPNYLKAEATEKFIGLTYEKYNDRFPGALRLDHQGGLQRRDPVCPLLPLDRAAAGEVPRDEGVRHPDKTPRPRPAGG